MLRGSSVSREYELTGPLKIGRGSDCEIQIADPRSSRHHAIIRLVEGGFELQDLDSTNGTYLNHIQILSPVGLQDGDLIQIGETYLKVMSGSSTAATAPSVRPQPVQTPAAPPLEEIPAEERPLAEQANQATDAGPSDVELPTWLHNPPDEIQPIPIEELESDDLPETDLPEPEPEPHSGSGPVTVVSGLAPSCISESEGHASAEMCGPCSLTPRDERLPARMLTRIID